MYICVYMLHTHIQIHTFVFLFIILPRRQPLPLLRRAGSRLGY